MSKEPTAEEAIAKLMADHIGHGMREKYMKHAEALMPLMVRIYNTGYQSGHHDTVEGGFVDITYAEREEYHEEEVRELIVDVT